MSFDHAVNQTAIENDALVFLLTLDSGGLVSGILRFNSPTLPTAFFTHFDVPLEPTSEWRWFDGGLLNERAATMADFTMVMSDLDILAIRGDYINGTETARIDNVNMVPEPSTGLLLASGLAALAVGRRRSAA